MWNPKSRSSRAWFHYTPIEGGKRAKCNHCDRAVVVTNGSTGNLFRHIKLKHPSISIEKRLKRGSYVVANQLNQVEISAERKKCAEELFSTSSDIQPGGLKSNSSEKSAQQPPVSFYLIQPYDENKRQEIDRQLLKVIVKELLPFSFVESVEFIKFINMLNPSYVLPSRKLLSSDILFNVYQDTLNNLKCTLKDVTAVTLTINMWTSVHNENFLAVTAHYLNKDLKLKSSLLECVSSYKEHSTPNIELFLQQLTSNWELSSKILAVVTDGSKKTAIDNCQWNHIPCFVHLLNEVVEEGLAEISSFISKVRNIVQHFRRNSVTLSRFHIIQNQLGLPSSKLKKDIPSRWDTTFDMLTRFLKNKVPLLCTIEQLLLYSFKLTSADFRYLESLIEILVIFNSIKVDMCSEKSVSLSKIPHFIRFMSRSLSKILENTELHSEIIKMGNTLKNGLKKFEILERSELVYQSVLLDPRFKKRGFPDIFLEEACTTLHHNATSVREELLLEKCNEVSLLQSQDIRTESEYFIDMWSEFESKDTIPQQNTSTNAASLEVDAFLNDSYLSMESDPLSYWANLSNQSKFPALFELAKRIFCIPATCIPCQQIYSKAGNVFLKKRCFLPSTKTEKILFLNHNL